MQSQLTHFKKDLKQRGLDAVTAIENGNTNMRAEVVLRNWAKTLVETVKMPLMI
jgi:hypothetical protein